MRERVPFAQYKAAITCGGKPVGRLNRIWPPQHEVARWPPLWGLDDDGIDHLKDFNPFIRR